MHNYHYSSEMKMAIAIGQCIGEGREVCWIIG